MRIRNKAPVSPLRYPGAKRWMANYIRLSITQNDVQPELFVEPFAGGASVSLSVLHEGLATRIGLIDRDPLIAAFWKTLFFDTEWLIEQVQQTEVTLQKWNYLKIQKPVTVRDKAFKCLYLNRTSFSGILKSNAGPIGGKEQTSPYKIDCRFNKETIIKRIQRIAKYRDRVAFIWNLHWKTALGRIHYMQERDQISQSVLFYLDPPFYKKAEQLYTYSFKHNDHILLRNYLVSCSQPWILSYDSCPEIIEMYLDGGFRTNDVNLIYKTQRHGRGLGKEVIVSNLPKMISELQLGADKSLSKSKYLSQNVSPLNQVEEVEPVILEAHERRAL